MKGIFRLFSLIVSVLYLVVLCGCGSTSAQQSSSKEETPPVETSSVESSPELEDTPWEIVSVTSDDFGISGGLQNPAFEEIFNHVEDAPLDKLIAFCLSADALSEGAYEELYQRFLEAPNAVLSYLALMGYQTVELTGQGYVSASEYICERIGMTDCSHGTTDEFAQVIKTARQTFSAGGFVQTLLSRVEMGRGTFKMG